MSTIEELMQELKEDQIAAQRLSAQEVKAILANVEHGKYASVMIFVAWVGQSRLQPEVLVYEEPSGSKMTFESWKRNLKRKAKQQDRNATAAECLRVTGNEIQRESWVASE